MELTKYTCLIHFKIVDQYQQEHPILMAKFKSGKYKRVIFCGGSNKSFNLITCEYKNIDLLIL